MNHNLVILVRLLIFLIEKLKVTLYLYHDYLRKQLKGGVRMTLNINFIQNPMNLQYIMVTYTNVISGPILSLNLYFLVNIKL